MSAVQAGREPLVSPSGVDREARARWGGNTPAKSPAPEQSRKACDGRSSVSVPQTDTGRLAEEAKVDE